MTAETQRKSRRQKRRQWQNRGGGGMVRKSSGRSNRVRAGGKGALQKVSPFWQTVIGILTLGVAASAVVIIVYGIFFA